MSHRLLLSSLALAIAPLAPPLSADLLVSYSSAEIGVDTDPVTAGTQLAPTMPPATTISGVSASAVSVGSGFGRSSGHSVDSFSVSFKGSVTESLASAMTKNTYYEFTVTPGSGQSLALSALDLKAFLGERSSTEYNPDGTVKGDFIYWKPQYTLFSDLTGGFTAGNQFAEYLVPTTAAGANYATSLDLSGVAPLQQITGTATFRIYLHNTEPRRTFTSNSTGGTATRANYFEPLGIGTSASATGGADVLVLHGLVTVPEPAVWAGSVSVLALLLAVWGRRRRIS